MVAIFLASNGHPTWELFSKVSTWYGCEFIALHLLCLLLCTWYAQPFTWWWKVYLVRVPIYCFALTTYAKGLLCTCSGCQFIALHLLCLLLYTCSATQGKPSQIEIILCSYCLAYCYVTLRLLLPSVAKGHVVGIHRTVYLLRITNLRTGHKGVPSKNSRPFFGRGAVKSNTGRFTRTNSCPPCA